MEKIHEFETKVERVRRMMAAKSAGGVIIESQADFSWLTGGAENRVSSARENGEAQILVTADKVFLLANNIEMPRLAAEEIPELPLEKVEFPWHGEDEFRRNWLESNTTGTILSDDLPGREKAEIHRLHFPLLEPEIGRYRELGREVARALYDTALETSPGETEVEIGARLAGSLLAGNIFPPVILVAADGRASLYRHPLPTTTRLKKHLMLVACGRRAGLIVSATRILSFGAPEEETAARHRAVTNVDAAVINATVPGRPLKEIFTVLEAAYEQNGWPGEWRHHHQGGPTGYRGRYQKVSAETTGEVQAGSAFAWNPSISGTKSEDTIIVHREGEPEIVSRDDGWPLLHPGSGPGRPDILVR